MKRIFTTICLLGLGWAAAASGAGFAIYPSYWETDALDETFGGGLAFGIPLGAGFDLDLRASYYEELDDDPLEALFEDDDPVFERMGIDVLPVELGLRYNFGSGRIARPYVGAGVSYFFLDSDREVVDLDDEVGFYALLGSRFGDGRGADFLVEGFYRQVEATAVKGDIGDLEERVDLDLDGLGLNVGVVWTW